MAVHSQETTKRVCHKCHKDETTNTGPMKTNESGMLMACLEIIKRCYMREHPSHDHEHAVIVIHGLSS